MDTFRMANRGIVLAGNIMEGLISIGDYIVFEINGKELKRKILQIEGIHTTRDFNVGIIIETIDNDEIVEIRNWAPNGIESLVYKT